MTATPPREELLRNLLRAARVIGLVHGAAMFAVATFIGAITSHVAASLMVGNGWVTGANTFGGMWGSVLAIVIIVRRRGVPRRSVTVSYFLAAAAGAALVAVAGLPFARPGILFLYLGLCLLALALVALTPVRPAVARSFAGIGRDGTFTSRSRAWSYGSIGVLALVVGGVATSPLGWRVGTGIFAGWLIVCAVMLARFRQYPRRTRAQDRLDPWALWRLARFGEQQRMVAAVGASAFTAEMVYISFEPFLSAPSRLGAAAPVFVGAGLAVVKLVLVPFILRQGELSDERVRRSAQRAARYLAAGSLVAVLALVSQPVATLLAVLWVASLLIELGVGPMADAARTYGSRLALEADAMTTVMQQEAYDIAGLVATVIQLPWFLAWMQHGAAASARLLGHLSFFPLVIVALLGAGGTVLLTTSHNAWTEIPGTRLVVNDGPPTIRLTVGLVPGTLAVYRVHAQVRCAHVTIPRMPDGGRFVVHSVLPGGTSDPQVHTCDARLDRKRPRPLRRTRGLLYPYRRVPTVGWQTGPTGPFGPPLRVGWTRWRGSPGTWALEEHAVVITSDELNRQLVTGGERHNA